MTIAYYTGMRMREIISERGFAGNRWFLGNMKAAFVSRPHKQRLSKRG
jgi:hypothetical protein